MYTSYPGFAAHCPEMILPGTSLAAHLRNHRDGGAVGGSAAFGARRMASEQVVPWEAPTLLPGLLPSSYCWANDG